MRSVVAVAALLMSASYAYCQSAEETVNYLLFGYEGHDIEKNVGPLKLSYLSKDDSDSFAMHLYRNDRKVPIDEDMYIFKLTKVSDCIYSYQIKGLNTVKLSDENVREYANYTRTYDFSKVVDISLASNGMVPVSSFQGINISCTSDDAGACERAEHDDMYVNLGDEFRFGKAWAYFKQTYCGGSAF